MKRFSLVIAIIFGLFSTFFAIEATLLEHWQKTMRFGISSQRSAIIKSIEDNKVTEAYTLLQEALVSDPNPEIRGQCVYAMVNLKLSNETVWLNSLVNETNSDVIRKKAFGVSEMGVSSAAPKLFVILTNRIDNPKESQLSATLLRTLGNLQYKASGDLMLSVLTNLAYSVEIRSSAAVALGDLKDKRFISNLTAVLQNPGEPKEVRMYCAYGIGKTGDKSALEILTPFIDNENEDLNIRLWSIAGLAFVSDPAIGPKLIEFSKVDNVRIRLEAVKAMARINTPESIDILKFKAQFDPDLGVKREAKKSLQTLGIEVEQLGSSSSSKPTAASSSSSRPAAAPGLPNASSVPTAASSSSRPSTNL